MKWRSNSTQFEKAPPGSHIARCYLVVDLGTQAKKAFGGEGITHERQVRIAFELPTEKMAGTFDPKSKGRAFSISQNFKQSLHPKANLRKMLVGWRGRDFKTAEEVEAFDPRKLPGLPCRVNLVESESGEYVNIASVAPLGKAEKCPKQVNKSVYLSLEEEEFDPEVFKGLHDALREKIAKSPEYQKLMGGHTGDGPQEDPAGDEPPNGGGEGDPDCPF